MISRLCEDQEIKLTGVCRRVRQINSGWAIEAMRCFPIYTVALRVGIGEWQARVRANDEWG